MSGIGIPPPFGEGIWLGYNAAVGGSNPPVYTIYVTLRHYMKAFFFLFLLIPITVASAKGIKDDPYELFDSSRTMYNNASIEIHSVDDVSTQCEQESRRRGFGGFPYKVFACTFWNEGGQRKCSIYLPKKTDMHQLGHEVRHCFYGAWHE